MGSKDSETYGRRGGGEAELQRLKKQLKAWEQGFAVEHGRKATKEDIKGRPAIRKMYKVYKRLVDEHKQRAACVRKREEETAAEEEQRGLGTAYVDAPISPPKGSQLLLAQDVGSTLADYYSHSLRRYRSMVSTLPARKESEADEALDFSTPEDAAMDGDHGSSGSEVAAPLPLLGRKRGREAEPEESGEPIAKVRKVAVGQEAGSRADDEGAVDSEDAGFLWGGGVDARPSGKRSKATENFIKLKLKSKGFQKSRGHRKMRAQGSTNGAASRVSGVQDSRMYEADINGDAVMSDEEDSTEAAAGQDDTDVETPADVVVDGGIEVAESGRPGNEVEDALDALRPATEWDEVMEADGDVQMAEGAVADGIFPLIPSESEEELRLSLSGVLQHKFGFDGFQDGQIEAVSRTVRGLSTLLIIPTGGGKSLCYQLPALLTPPGSIVLVVSPLLSLMRDQMRKLPPCLPGACLNSTQSSANTKQVLRNLKDGKVKVLFVSPEKLMSEKLLGMWDRRICRMKGTRPLPPIAFACIDEAHCISQWSHNFRPAYLRIAVALQERLGVGCILGLTATCSPQAQETILKVIRATPEAVIRRSPVRSNLTLTASNEVDKYKGLLEFFSKAGRTPAVIYCMFQKDTEMLASYLHSNGFAGKVAAYHAGMTSSIRRKIQDKFIAGKLPIVAATVAFGMGIDKSDIRSVVHFGLPRTVENSVQEVGRAGRDGQPAWCHLFVNDDDLVLLYSLIHSDVVERANIKKLLLALFKEPKGLGCMKNDAGSIRRRRQGSEKEFLVSLPTEETGIKFDMRKEALDTILTHLEQLCGTSAIKLLPASKKSLCVVQFLVEPSALAKSYPVAKSIMRHSSMSSSGSWKVNLAAVANDFLAAESSIMEQLVELRTKGCLHLEVLEDECVQLWVRKKPEKIDDLLSALTQMSRSMQESKRAKLFKVYNLADMAAFPSVRDALQKDSMDHLDEDRELHVQISRYFDESSVKENEDGETVNVPPILKDIAQNSQQEEELVRVIERVRRRVEEEAEQDRFMLSGLQTARILHGVGSPQRPAQFWYSFPGFGRYKAYRFDQLRALANRTLARLRM